MKCIFLDFFGTIVDYVPGRASGVKRSCAVLRSFGLDTDEEEFTCRMDAAFARFEKRSDRDDSEFSMTQVCESLVAEDYGAAVADDQIQQLVQAYLKEWNAGVRYPAGMADTIRALAAEHRLA